MADRDDGALETSVAIIGMACYFPDAGTPEEFWTNLAAGRESVRQYDEAALRAAGVTDAELSDPAYVRAGVPLDGFDLFDAGFFGLSPREAKVMDPQHRKFLECAWSALEDAGHTPASAAGNIGVFAGSGMHWYLIKNVMTNPELVREMGEFLVRHTSNDKDFMATRVSYQFDLHGPSINVQTACSTSLVAVHLACQSLLSGESDIALAGGSTIEVPHGVGYVYREEEVRSPDGHCRSMDAASGGTVFGSGCGVVVLRRLVDALADGDSIRAVIRGSAINNDGAGKAGFMAPSVDGQAQAIAEAIAVAGVPADTIGYVEAHGTATRIGDPIEIAALTQGFGPVGRKQYCALGSVKSNIGHLDTAAGVAGLIKVALAMEHRQLPASLHYHSANPEIEFSATPFYVNDRLSEWPSLRAPLRAGLSSLGVGGTNAHVVIEEAPVIPAGAQDAAAAPASVILPISAKTSGALTDAVRNLRTHLEQHPKLAPNDVAWTMRQGRVAFECRTAVAGRTIADLVRQLGGAVRQARAAEAPPQVVFMFPGQGAQYPNMARRLYGTDASFQTTLDACFAVLKTIGRDDVRAALFPEEAGPEAAAALRNTAITQPALFCVEYALASALMAKGVRPAAMIGHSLGEYVAACLAGAFTLDAAIRLVCRRGQLIGALPAGAMVAVSAGAGQIREFLSGRVALASVNGPELTVCAGQFEAIEDLVSQLTDAGIGTRRLETSHAFHSPMLEPMLEPFRAEVAGSAPRAALDLKVVSNLTGRWLTPEEAASPDYWTRHVRQTVRFAEGVQQLAELGPTTVFVEVGPGSTLSTFVKASRPDSAIVPTLPHAKDATADDDFFTTAGGLLWAHGLDVDWAAWRQPLSGKRVPLPTYPFQRQRHWVAPMAQAAAIPAPAPSARAPLQDWFYVTDWRSSSGDTVRATPQRVLVFSGSHGLGSALVDGLKRAGVAVVSVTAGPAFEREGDRITIRPAATEDWDRLVKEVQGCSHIAYLWPADDPRLDDETARQVCFDYLLSLAKRVERVTEGTTNPALLVATANAHSVGAESALDPWQTLVAGPVRTLPQEMSGLRAVWMDLDAAETARHPRESAAAVRDELERVNPDETVAWRHRRRFTPVSTRLRLESTGDDRLLRQSGTYLVTGGLGGAGQALSEHLARTLRARLILIARTPLPDRRDWDAYLRASQPGDEARRRIQVVRRLESFGAHVDVASVDVADAAALARAVASIGQMQLDGVFHAAGVLDDGVIAKKGLEAAHRVLRPKVDGTLALQALEALNPRFMVYFSSVSAHAGLSGQVDYTSANAFLNALATRQDADSVSCRHIALQWSMWRDAGMAARLSAEMGVAPREPVSADVTDHPVLTWKTVGPAGTVTYSGIVTPEGVWYLDQHRLRSGDAILPGTGFIELIGAALRDHLGEVTPLEFIDLTFQAPLVLAARSKRLLRVEIRGDADGGYEVSVASQGADPDDLLEHTIARVQAPAVRTPMLEPLAGSADLARVNEPYSHPELMFGPRWNCLRGMVAGRSDATLELSVDPDELFENPLHPALLDMAVGAAQRVLADAEIRDHLLPYRYGRLQILAPLTASLISHVRARSEKDTLHLDVDVVAPDGALLVVVRDFVLKVSRRTGAAPRHMTTPRRGRLPSVSHIVQVGFDDGLTNAEAMQVLERVLGGGSPAHIMVATRDFDRLIRETRSPAPIEAEAAPAGEDFLPRPEIATAYVPPESDLERVLASMWESALEIRGVGTADNFFELGGHSLLLTKLVTRLRKDRGVTLPLEQAFDDATIAGWSRLASVPAPAAPAKSIKKADRDKYRLSVVEQAQ